MKTSIRLTSLLCLAATLIVAVGCTDEETELGSTITGNGSRYNGQRFTLYANSAASLRDDSLMTTGYSSYNSYGIIGNYSDATFGKVSAMLYTQIALPSNANDINFSEMIIDSVVLSLVKQNLYPDSVGSYSFHFEVMQLAEAVQTDTLYYSYDSLPVNPSGRFFDGAVSVGPHDTVVSLVLGNGIGDVLRQTATSDEFIQRTKGLRVRLTDAGDEGMLSINFAAVKTCLTVFYRYRAEDTVSSRYPFLLGTGTTRFSRFIHDYSGSITAGADSIDGSQLLYMEPLAGYSALLSFDSAIRAFHAEHPTATVHHAELLLPVAPQADAIRPDQLLARKNSGSKPYIADLIDLYTMAGFDGRYDDERGCYRLRVTQHVQGLLRDGGDPGLLLTLNARQNDAARTILNGCANANPAKIDIVFSE